MFQQLLVNKHHRLRDSVPITIWPSGGLRLVTDIKKNNNKSRVKQEPRSAHGRAVNKSRVKQEPRSAHGRAVNKKTPFSDKIKNEMIKSSLNQLMPVYLKLFNTALRSGTVPQTWCNGLITPIFQNGTYVESVFLAVLGNYFAQFSTKDFLNTSSHLRYFINLKLGFYQIIKQRITFLRCGH